MATITGTAASESIQGTAADDLISGLAGEDTLEGLDGNDTIYGGPDQDRLRGGNGDDSLDGGDGRDSLYGGDGNDTLNAGTGSSESQGAGDFIRPGAGSNTIIGHQGLFATGEGADLSYEDVDGSGGIVITVGANGSGTAVSNIQGVVNDTFTYIHYFAGTLSNDTFHGSANENWEGWAASGGNDTINGGDGYDELLYNNDHWEGGTGGVTVNFATHRAIDGFGDTDTFTGIEAVRGTAQGDLFIGSESEEFLSFRGLEGNDTITGSSGWDRADYRSDANYGGSAGIVADLAAGTIIDGFGDTDQVSNIDQVRGTNSDDTMTAAGLSQSVRFDGSNGADRLTGGSARDTLHGGDGADTLTGNAGDDIIIGGDSEADLRDVVFGGAGNDYIDGGYGNDELRGDAGNDTIEGGYGADTVIGGDGDDALTGQTWSDAIFGGAGSDFINGGFGHDRVNGGTGADQFYHLGVEGHGSDWIQDFSDAEGDVLVYGGGSATAADFQVNFTETASAGAAGVQEAFVIYRPTGQILWALVDGGAQDQIMMRLGGAEIDLLA
ncbi:calcium-binding protein [Maritimibacter alkaliphilus]|uniref:calcium-binding protein n=1 Tax=Maritimibacter alkaliphilus TaxID=404236 RepID=UPI0021BD61E9|nr:calcium-binding protein [Maritimibacter alkaliphilus]